MLPSPQDKVSIYKMTVCCTLSKYRVGRCDRNVGKYMPQGTDLHPRVRLSVRQNFRHTFFVYAPVGVMRHIKYIRIYAHMHIYMHTYIHTLNCSKISKTVAEVYNKYWKLLPLLSHNSLSQIIDFISYLFAITNGCSKSRFNFFPKYIDTS